MSRGTSYIWWVQSSKIKRKRKMLIIELHVQVPNWEDSFIPGLAKQAYSSALWLLHLCRLFTAADSDDISTAIQCINKARPWTTFVAVGWGYGANMLTKYLAEVGEHTPLTAATCIDNPFDLEEATRFSMHHIDFDRSLTSGFISILHRNKVVISYTQALSLYFYF